MLQAYGRTVLDTDDTETARAKIEAEIRRLPTATWEWLNQSETNELGDLRVWQVLPGRLPGGVRVLGVLGIGLTGDSNPEPPAHGAAGVF